jgi:hypothetical protein
MAEKHSSKHSRKRLSLYHIFSYQCIRKIVLKLTSNIVHWSEAVRKRKRKGKERKKKKGRKKEGKKGKKGKKRYG